MSFRSQAVLCSYSSAKDGQTNYLASVSQSGRLVSLQQTDGTVRKKSVALNVRLRAEQIRRTAKRRTYLAQVSRKEEYRVGSANGQTSP